MSTEPERTTFRFTNRGGPEIRKGHVYYAHTLLLDVDRRDALDLIRQLATLLQDREGERLTLSFSGTLERFSDDAGDMPNLWPPDLAGGWEP